MILDDEMVSDKLTVLVCIGLLESVTLKVSGAALAVAVGVPVIAPVDAFRESPDGRFPLVSDHAYGAVPPEAASVAL
ncbi:MAG TPA: hypothetical protein VMU48_03545 [Terracidiphilus sp.]|nr:hypothetical protein [Terracidiphilus sp.]